MSLLAACPSGGAVAGAALCIATACAQGGFPTSAPSQDARAAPPGRSASAPARVAPVAPVAARAPVATADAWPIVRGGPAQRGVAVSPLPDALTVRWQRELGESIESTAAIAGGVVYVGCDDGFLYAFALADGAPQWKYEARGPVKASPTVAGGVVYVGDEEGWLHAVEAASGRARWTFETGGEIYASVLPLGERLIFGSYDGFLYALRAADGSVAWKYETPDRIHATPGFSRGRLLVAGCDATLHMIDAASGEALAEAGIGAPCGAAPAALGDRVFVGTYGNEVLAVDLDAARVAWRYRDPQREFPYMSSAAVADGHVYIGGRDRRFRALEAASGEQAWEFAARGRIDSSGVIVGSRVFFGSSDGNLYALDRATGKPVWKYETASPITASPAVAGECLVIGTQDGVLYCFGGPR